MFRVGDEYSDGNGGLRDGGRGWPPNPKDLPYDGGKGILMFDGRLLLSLPLVSNVPFVSSIDSGCAALSKPFSRPIDGGIAFPLNGVCR